jgi:hypothetical protein
MPEMSVASINFGWCELVLVESGDEKSIVVSLAHSVAQDIQALHEVHVRVVLR